VTDCLARADEEAWPLISAADKKFLAAFEQCELPEFRWTHLAHIRLAWICLSLAPPAEALDRIRGDILRYNTEVLHRRHKYHETVTVAYAHIVAERMQDGESWPDFAERIDDLLDPVHPLLLGYYSEDRLFSDKARMEFVEPDLKEIPSLAEN
jgi:hypothetical protein